MSYSPEVPHCLIDIKEALEDSGVIVEDACLEGDMLYMTLRIPYPLKLLTINLLEGRYD
jgi:hypothetical protein